MSISVLIPWRDTGVDRRMAFDWTTLRCEALLPAAQICVADSGHEPFNRGASVNCAATQARGDALVILDADTFFHQEQIIEAVQSLHGHDVWILPYEVYINLDVATTGQLLSSSPTVTVDPMAVGAEFRLTDSVSGLIVLTRSGFEQVGGFDERFRGWGFEDRAFECAANTLLAPCLRLPGYCYHLAHEVTERFDQPEIHHNRNLAEQYRQSTGQPDRMRQLVGR